MPKIPVWDKSNWPTEVKASKKNWKNMNREVKPREKEILNRLEEINKTRKATRIEARRLHDELQMVRNISTFGTNTVKLYVLRLQNDCWYIGMSYDVERRFKKHAKGKGAVWTKLYKPIEIHHTKDTGLYSQDEVAYLEDDLTLEYALKYGSDKVRGGGYCQSKPAWPDIVRQNELIREE